MTAYVAFTSDRACGPYIRGRMWMAGIRPESALTDALDVLEVVLMDTPRDQLVKKRKQQDMQTAVAQARAGTLDKDTWGMTPEQQAATRPLLGGA